jgi:hypothetical protein
VKLFPGHEVDTVLQFFIISLMQECIGELTLAGLLVIWILVPFAKNSLSGIPPLIYLKETMAGLGMLYAFLFNHF